MALEGQTSYCYQINLILKDAQRLNVINHGNLQSIRADAQTNIECLLDECSFWQVILAIAQDPFDESENEILQHTKKGVGEIACNQRLGGLLKYYYRQSA